MTTGLAEILKGYIETLSFVDKIAGLTRVASFVVEGETNDTTGVSAKKRIQVPVGCNVTDTDCLNGKYADLCPDDRKKSVIYFEEAGGSNFISRDRDNLNFTATLRLVGWLNLKKMGQTDCSITAAIVPSIIAALPFQQRVNNGVFLKLQITSVSEAEKSAAIFSKYTYEEPVVQYLLFPYDYFALNITCNFSINKNCIDNFIIEPEICAND